SLKKKLFFCLIGNATPGLLRQHFPSLSLSSETDTGCCYPARCPHHREDNNRPKLPLANKTREQPKSTPAHKLPASLPDISG
uniref:Uncharacterized protein n=1 Tax=Anser brachyrhynchus TaxID=132585 RepID=A0A8B9BJE8_9AVES